MGTNFLEALDHLSPSELAGIVGISTRTARRWLKGEAAPRSLIVRAAVRRLIAEAEKAGKGDNDGK